MPFPILLKRFLKSPPPRLLQANQPNFEREREIEVGGGELPKKAIQTTDGDDESDLIFI